MTRHDGKPVTYKRNDAYFEWRRVNELATTHSGEELRDRMEELTARIAAYEQRYDATSPGAVDADAAAETNDERTIDEVYIDLSAWATAREQRDRCKRAQQHRAFGVPDDDDAFGRVASHVMPDGESRVWNNAVMELGGVACGTMPRCDEAGCPWRGWCHAYETGDFTAPDVPTQPEFEGSRRQFRGRIVRTLGEYDALALDELGPRIRVDYAPDGEHGREWLRGLVDDLADDGLVAVEERDGAATGGAIVSLRR